MPHGYFNRLSSAYWSSDNLIFSGGVWTSNGFALTDFEMTPEAALNMAFVFEVRFVIQFQGHIGVPTGTITVSQNGIDRAIFFSAIRTQRWLTIRLGGGGITGLSNHPVLFEFSPGSQIEIKEIEVGYIGTF